jgi:hypothetical protein
LAYAGPARAVHLVGRGLVGVNLLRKLLAALGPAGGVAAGSASRREPPAGGQ